MGNTITNEIVKKKEEAAEFLELMEKVPSNKKERVLGIIEGVAMSAELEQRGAQGGGKMEGIKKRIAALEKEQLEIRKLLNETNESNKQLLEIVKQLRVELGLTKIGDANITKQLSQWREDKTLSINT